MIALSLGSGNCTPGKKAAVYNFEHGFLDRKILLKSKLNKMMAYLITFCVHSVTSKGQKAGKVRFLLDQSTSVVCSLWSVARNEILGHDEVL